VVITIRKSCSTLPAVGPITVFVAPPVPGVFGRGGLALLLRQPAGKKFPCRAVFEQSSRPFMPSSDVGDLQSRPHDMAFVEEHGSASTTQLRGLDGHSPACPNGRSAPVENLTKDWSRGELQPLRFSADEDLAPVLGV